jgi:hypothetical protein
MKIDVWEFKDSISVNTVFDFLDKIAKLSDIDEEELKQNPMTQLKNIKKQIQYKIDFLNEHRTSGPKIDKDIESHKLNEIFTEYQKFFLGAVLG